MSSLISCKCKIGLCCLFLTSCKHRYQWNGSGSFKEELFPESSVLLLPGCHEIVLERQQNLTDRSQERAQNGCLLGNVRFPNSVFTTVIYRRYQSKDISCLLALKGVWRAVQRFDRAHYGKEENFSWNKIRSGQ